MTLWVLDTDSLSLLERGNPNIQERLRQVNADSVAISIVTAEELTAKAIGLNSDESSSVLDHLIRSGDLSRFGMLNAVTRTAEDIESYDRATEVERLGSSVLYLPQSTWQEVATARN